MQRRTLTFIAGSLLVAFGCGGNDPVGTPDVCITTPWLSSTGYQTAFDGQHALNCYPTEVRGREGATELEYQGVFEPIPPDPFDFASVHGRDQAAFDQLEANLLGQGFQRIWLQTFTASDTIERFQATWTQP